jgi:hypothetical protein
MKAPGSPCSIIEHDPSYDQMMKTLKETDDSGSFGKQDEDLKIFSDLFNNVENTLGLALDELTVDSNDLSEENSSDDMDDCDEDDDLESEWAELATVEDSLRKELERQKIYLTKKDGERGETHNQDYTLYDHYKSLKLEEVKGFGFFCDKSHFFKAQPLDCREFCQPIPDKKLASLYYGLTDDKESTLPFRTVAYRIRPDSQCNLVIDSVCNAIAASSKDNNINLLRRQGGHLRAVVVNEYGPFVVDAQMCIARSRDLQRQLLMRMYYATPKEIAEAGVFLSEDCRKDKMFERLLRDKAFPANNHLKEACSLVQMMNRLGISGDRESLEKPFPTAANRSSTVASSNLRSKFTRSSSVRMKRGRNLFRKSTPLLPALSQDDWLVLQSSWSLCENVFEGFASIYAFSSLCSKPLDRDIEIPCLDQRYCMDLFRLSAEEMLIDLEQAKANLQYHEKKGKYVSDVFKNITKPMFELYDIESIEKVPATDLDSFDLSAVDLEEEDNGSHVFVSLATKAILSSKILDNERTTMESESEIADDAVHIVNKAFQSYHCGIQSKLMKAASNEVQNTLYHHKFCIQEIYRRLQRTYRSSNVAIEESNNFLELVQEAKNLRTEGNEFSIAPFLKCQIQGGECYITETHILLFTNKLFQQPRIVEMFKSSSALVFALADIDVQVVFDSYLQISAKLGKGVIQFSPISVDVEQMNLFIAIMQSLHLEHMKQSSLA